MIKLSFKSQENTETLLQYVLDSITDEELEDIEVERNIKNPDGLASEPITVAAIITLTTLGASVFLRLVERYLENERQIKTLEIVADGFKESDEIGMQLAEIAKKHSDISISYGLAKESWNSEK